MGILDPQDFSLGTEPTMKSFQDRISELRSGLPPTVAALQPPLPGQPQLPPPGQVSVPPGPVPIPAMANGGFAGPMGSAPDRNPNANLRMDVNQVAGTMPPTGASTGAPRPGTPEGMLGDAYQWWQQIGPKMQQQVMKELSNLDPPKLMGPDLFGRGGIMGTGLEPIDVLSFAVGAALTGGMPQAQAMEWTMKIAQLPSLYKHNQREASMDFLRQATGIMNAQTQAANSQTSQINSARAEQQYSSRLALADAYRRAGRPADALAMEADAVNDYAKLNGSQSDHFPTNLGMILPGIASGVIQAPQSLMDAMGARTPQEAAKLAEQWLGAYLQSQPVTPLPDQGAILRTPSGPRPIGAETDAPVPSIGGIRNQVNQIRGGGQPAAPMAPGVAPAAPGMAPPPALGGAPAAPIGQPMTPQAPGVVPMQRPDARLELRGQQPQQPQNFANQLSQSPDKQDQWIAKYSPDLLPQTEARMRPLFQRPMDAGQRQRLIAQHATLDYAVELANDYEAMVKSYGGDAKFTLKPQLTQYLMNLGTRISGEGVSGAALTMASDAANYLAQRYGATLTPEANKFLGTYAQAQKFARGAMNDAANLAVRERTYFNQMTGTPLDKPSVFRSKISSFAGSVAKEYNSALQQNKLYNTEGWEPFDVKSLPGAMSQPRRQEQPTQPVEPRAIPTPNGQLPPGWEVVRPPAGNSREY